MRGFEVSSPLFIEIGVKKIRRVYLNLNTYRNLHYQTNNQVKRAYAALIGRQIPKVSFDNIKITYTLYVGTLREVDISNVCSIVDKFFCDAMVTRGVIVDDNYKFLKEVVYKYGGLDRENPRVMIKVEETESEETT